MYQYSYEYESANGTVLGLIYFVVLGVLLLAKVIEYIVMGIGLYQMAAKRNHPTPWMAFVPFARTYLRGELSGDIYLKRQKLKNPGLWLVVMPIVYGVISCSIMLVCFICAIFGSSVMINAGGTSQVGSVLMIVWIVPLLVISIIYTAAMNVLNVLVDYQIYRLYMPIHFAVVHAVLGIFVPLYRGIYLFLIRNKPYYRIQWGQRTEEQNAQGQRMANPNAQEMGTGSQSTMPQPDQEIKISCETQQEAGKEEK